MVRVIVAALFAVLATLPAMAQDDYPRIEMSLGYANIGFFCCSEPSFTNSRHSGFASTQGLNLTRIFGIENYFGYYGVGGRNNPRFGTNASLIANMVGAKAAARRFERAVPYVVAGIGAGYLTDESTFGQTSFATRFGPGVDLKLNDSMAWKVDFTRMSFHFGAWRSGWNLSTGIVFVLSN